MKPGRLSWLIVVWEFIKIAVVVEIIISWLGSIYFDREMWPRNGNRGWEFKDV